MKTETTSLPQAPLHDLIARAYTLGDRIGQLNEQVSLHNDRLVGAGANGAGEIKPVQNYNGCVGELEYNLMRVNDLLDQLEYNIMRGQVA